LTNIDQGDTDTTRDGNSIKLTTLLMRGSVIFDDTTNEFQPIRIMLVKDTQTNQAQFSITDLLQSTSVYSSLNIDNGKRFRILYDRLLNVYADKPQIMLKFKKAIPFHIRYDNTGNGIADLTQNSLALVAISPNVTSDGPVLTTNFKIRYVDN